MLRAFCTECRKSKDSQKAFLKKCRLRNAQSQNHAQSGNAVFESQHKVLKIFEDSLEYLEDHTAAFAKRQKLAAKKSQPLYHFARVLKCVYFNEPVCPLLVSKLSAPQSEFLRLVLVKERLLDPAGTGSLRALLATALARAEPKSLDENLKFVVSRAFPILVDFFRANCFEMLRSDLRAPYSAWSPRRQLVYGFYGYYFGHLCAGGPGDVERFFCPTNRGRRLTWMRNAQFKTISKRYLQRLSLSHGFKADLEFALLNFLVPSLKDELTHKINRFCRVWSPKMGRALDSGDSREMLAEFGRQSPGKLPWTLREARTAIRAVRELIEKL